MKVFFSEAALESLQHIVKDDPDAGLLRRAIDVLEGAEGPEALDPAHIDWQRDGVTALRIDGEDRSLVLHGALRTEGERSDADAVDFLVFFAVEVDPPLLGIGTDEVLKRLRSPEPLVRHQTVNDLAMQVHHRAGS